MNIISSLSQKLRSARLVAGFMAIATVASFGASGVVSATSPDFFNVPKGSPQSVCYKQLGTGWKALGFKNLDHCLRYVTTPPATEKSDCNTGWWYVYGFNSLTQCKEWVVANGGGGYDGDPSEQY